MILVSFYYVALLLILAATLAYLLSMFGDDPR